MHGAVHAQLGRAPLVRAAANGATVNLNSTSTCGFFTLDHFIEDMTMNVGQAPLQPVVVIRQSFMV